MATAVKRGDSYKITASCGYDITGKQIRKHTTWTPLAGMTPRQISKELERQKVLLEEQISSDTTEEVKKLLDAGLIDEDGELIEVEDLEADLIPAEVCNPAPARPIFAAGIQNSVVVQGNTAQTIIVNVGEGRALTEEEDELLRILRSLRVRGRTKLLSFAYALEEQQLGDPAPVFASLLAGSRE